TIKKLMPPMLKAGEMLDGGDEIGGWMLVGRTYSYARLTKEAREALGRARTAAEKANKPKSVQAVDIAFAVMLAYEGKPQRAISDLTKIAAKPFDDENAALAWLYIGLAQEQ